MKALLRIEARVAVWARRVAFIGLIGLLGQSLAISLDVLLRWIAGTPIYGLEDVNAIVITVIVAAFFPVLLAERGNVTISFLGDYLGKRMSPRVPAGLDAFGHLVTFVFITIIAWQVFLHAADLGSQETLILRLPAAPGWWVTSVLLGMCVPIQFLVFLVHGARAVTGRTGEQSRP